MKIRDPFSALSHYAGALAALLGTLALLVVYGSTTVRVAAILIYGFSLIGLFLSSAVYHTVITTPEKTLIFRKIDHSAIYLLIAGTYTPICLLAFTGFWQWGLLSIVWALAVIGIVVKIFFLHAPRWVTAGVYVVMGWLCIFAVGEMMARLSPAAIGWLLTGGITYTLGAVIYITKKGNFFPGVFGFHEVWHIFVLLAAVAHFIAVVNIL